MAPRLTSVDRTQKKAAARERSKERKRKVRTDHLSREVKNTEMNWKKIQKQFRNMMLKIKLPWIKQDMETMWHRFEHTLDLKDCVIALLLDELDEDQVQTEYNLQAHVEAITDLLALLRERLEDLAERYNTELKLLLQEGAETRRKDLQMQKEAQDHLNTVIFIMDDTQNELMLNMQSEAITKIDEERNKFKDVRNLMCGRLERTLEELWELYRRTLTEYEVATLEKRKAFIRLKQRDEKAADVIFRQMLHIQKLFEIIRVLRERMKSLQPQQMLSALVDERRFFLDAFCQLRNRLRKEHEHDRQQLIILTSESNASMKWLDRLVAKGERMLKLASICRKLETQNEKIIMFSDDDSEEEDKYLPPVPPPPKPTKILFPTQESDDSEVGEEEVKEEEEEEAEDEVAVEEEQESISEQQSLPHMYKDYEFMERFWKRVGHIYTHQADLLGYREQLRQENRTLKSLLCRYLTGVSDGWDEQTHQEDRGPRRHGKPNVTEASHVYKNMLP